jgi:hypothetical protein
MRTRIARAAVAALAAGSLLLVPSVASAGPLEPVCEFALHDVGEPAAGAVDGLIGTDLAHEVHEAEEAVCPQL